MYVVLKELKESFMDSLLNQNRYMESESLGFPSLTLRLMFCQSVVSNMHLKVISSSLGFSYVSVSKVTLLYSIVCSHIGLSIISWFSVQLS